MHITKHSVIQRIESEVAATLADFGYALVQITFGGPAGNRCLTIYIDKPGGVASNDCGDMAERLSLLLDTLGAIEGNWTLIVSSPGVERPLTRDEDLVRFTGETAAVTVQTLDGKKKTRTGVIQPVAGDQLRMVCSDKAYEIPLADIIAAHLVYDWDQEPSR